ncbi:MAG: nucleotidyltransferase substrate binding protein [Bacteroidia bacterium]
MEPTEKYHHKLNDLKKAVASLDEALKVNLFSFTEEVSDLIQNGQIQKIEYFSEILWKTVKIALEEKNGLIATAPKNVY